MTVLPEWVYQLLDGLMDYDAMHPKLYSNHAWGYQPADCPCRLLEAVPDQAKQDARMFMQGARKAIETPASICTCSMLDETAPCLVHPERAEKRDPAERERRERLAVVVNQAQFGAMPSDAGPEVAE